MDSLSRKMRTCTHAHIIHTSGSFSSSKADPCAQDSLFKVLIIKKIRYSCGKLYRSPRRKKKNMPSLNNCPFSLWSTLFWNILIFFKKFASTFLISLTISMSVFWVYLESLVVAVIKRSEWQGWGLIRKQNPNIWNCKYSFEEHYYDMSLFIALCQGIPGTMII